MEAYNPENMSQYALTYFKANQALLGKIHPMVRRITVELNSSHKINHLKFYYNQLDPIQAHLENQIIKKFKEENILSDSFKKKSLLLPYPKLIPTSEDSIYRCYED